MLNAWNVGMIVSAVRDCPSAFLGVKLGGWLTTRGHNLTGFMTTEEDGGLVGEAVAKALLAGAQNQSSRISSVVRSSRSSRSNCGAVRGSS